MPSDTMGVVLGAYACYFQAGMLELSITAAMPSLQSFPLFFFEYFLAVLNPISSQADQKGTVFKMWEYKRFKLHRYFIIQ